MLGARRLLEYPIREHNTSWGATTGGATALRKARSCGAVAGPPCNRTPTPVPLGDEFARGRWSRYKMHEEEVVMAARSAGRHEWTRAR
jgi:hypothetical protein